MTILNDHEALCIAEQRSKAEEFGRMVAERVIELENCDLKKLELIEEKIDYYLSEIRNAIKTRNAIKRKQEQMTLFKDAV